jgi:hypothetical protein
MSRRAAAAGRAGQAGLARRLAAAALLAAATAGRAAAGDLSPSLDLGAGAKIDVAPYGIENVTALATAAPWLGLGARLSAGLVLAASAGPAKTDAEAALCLRVRVFEGLSLLAGGGLIAARGDGPALAPIVLGALRLGRGRLGLEACAEVHFKPADTDKMLWIAALWTLGPGAPADRAGF